MASIELVDTLKILSLHADWSSEPGWPVPLQHCSHRFPDSKLPCNELAVRWFNVEGCPKGRCDVHSPSADAASRMELSRAEALVLSVHSS